MQNCNRFQFLQAFRQRIEAYFIAIARFYAIITDMKKVILSISIIVMTLAIGLGLTACNNATAQGQLANILGDHYHETFVYDVTNSHDDETGVYTVKLDFFPKGSTVTNFGAATLSDVDKGILVSGELVHGKYTYKSGCYYRITGGTNLMVPYASYRIQTENGVQTFAVQGKYEGGAFKYDKTVGEETKKGELGASGLVFDNNQIQQVLRSATTFSSGLSMSFSTPIVAVKDENTAVAKLTASGRSATEKVKVPYTEGIDEFKEDGIPCYRVSLSRTTAISSIGQTYFYAANDLTYETTWGMKHVLIKAIEPYKIGAESFERYYSLRSAVIRQN